VQLPIATTVTAFPLQRLMRLAQAFAFFQAEHCLRLQITAAKHFRWDSNIVRLHIESST